MGRTKSTEQKSGKQPVIVQFRQDSKEFLKLLSLFQDGTIKPKDQPASIRSKYMDVFAKYTATQFRSQFHKARSLVGLALKNPEDDDDEAEEEEIVPEVVPVPDGSFAAAPSRSKTQAMLVAAAAHDPEETVHHWSPKKIVCSYVDPSGVRHITILFALTGGVIAHDNSGVQIKVTDNGFELSLSEEFPEYQLNMELYYHHRLMMNSVPGGWP